MKQTRYGIFIPPFGFVYDGAVWDVQRFTDDPTKASLGKSFKKKDDAIIARDTLMRRPEYETAQVVEYTITTAAVIYPHLPKADRDAQRRLDYAPKLELYKTLQLKYDAMSGKEVEDLPKATWNAFTTLKHDLLALELI